MAWLPWLDCLTPTMAWHGLAVLGCMHHVEASRQQGCNLENRFELTRTLPACLRQVQHMCMPGGYGRRPMYGSPLGFGSEQMRLTMPSWAVSATAVVHACMHDAMAHGTACVRAHAMMGRPGFSSPWCKLHVMMMAME